VNAESWQAEKQINVLQTGLADTKEKLASVDFSIETKKKNKLLKSYFRHTCHDRLSKGTAMMTPAIETTKAEYEKVKETDDAKLHAVQAQVEVAEETYQEAKNMATRVIDESFGEDCNDIEIASTKAQ
jgi:hypothetical protein